MQSLLWQFSIQRNNAAATGAASPLCRARAFTFLEKGFSVLFFFLSIAHYKETFFLPGTKRPTGWKQPIFYISQIVDNIKCILFTLLFLNVFLYIFCFRFSLKNNEASKMRRRVIKVANAFNGDKWKKKVNVWKHSCDHVHQWKIEKEGGKNVKGLWNWNDLKHFSCSEFATLCEVTTEDRWWCCFFFFFKKKLTAIFMQNWNKCISQSLHIINQAVLVIFL